MLYIITNVQINNIKKLINNVIGLGHQMDLNYLKNIGGVDGRHHIDYAIHMLENPLASNDPAIEIPNSTLISFHKYIDFLIENKIV